MVPAERIELPTFGLQNRCTTAVLRRHGFPKRRRGRAGAASDGLAPGSFGYQRGTGTASAAVPKKVTKNVCHRTATKVRLADCQGKTAISVRRFGLDPPEKGRPL